MSRSFDRESVSHMEMDDLLAARADLVARIGQTLEDIVAVTEGLGFAADISPAREETQDAVRSSVRKEREPWRKIRGKKPFLSVRARRRASMKGQPEAPGPESAAVRQAPSVNGKEMAGMAADEAPPGRGPYSGDGLEHRIGMFLAKCEAPVTAMEIAKSLREGDIGPSTLHGRVKRALTKMKREKHADSVGFGNRTKWMSPGSE